MQEFPYYSVFIPSAFTLSMINNLVHSGGDVADNDREESLLFCDISELFYPLPLHISPIG
ncbi:MAG: hypothetical protein P4L95_05100 [Rouxiella aceris]|uniref:hypothetical protein n=1 Tax=Rouxiella aceris TaxID=2703884 RepID=UPI00284ECB32|nr:hypothetical protein [Rouxiella aceris]MDR3431275.1 hypothetical protein [Rouxiella aceris]